MSQSSKSHETVTRLKELLFDRENRELNSLAGRIAELQARAGSDEQFQHSVAKVLKGALEQVEKSGPQLKDVSEAMAPMVLRTLDRELKSQNRQDQIAGIIYPRLGEIVRSYVASAVRDMMEKINRRLEGGLGRNRFMLWLRSAASGRTMAEQALADTAKLEVLEIYLVRRGSGELIHHWERDQPTTSSAAQHGANRDTLISGFLAAITAFAEEAFEADKESLRTVDFGDHRIYIRGSPDYLLAAKCTGSAPESIEQLLDRALLRVLEEHREIERDLGGGDTGAAHEKLLGDLAGDLDAQISERASAASRARTARTLKSLAAIIGLPILAFGAWYYYVSWTTQELQLRANQVLAGIPALKGYPVSAHVERGGSRIWVTGLAPNEETLRTILETLKAAAPSSQLSDAMSVLPTLDVETRLGEEALKRAIDGARRKLGALAADLATAQDRAPDGAEREALAMAEAATRRGAGDINRGDHRDGELVGAVRRAVLELRGAAERLGAVAGVEVRWPADVPNEALDGAASLMLAAERISVLVGVLEQRRAVVPIAKQIDTVRDRMAERIAELEKRLEQLRPPAPTPRAMLAAFISGHAIFFGNDVDYRNSATALSTLDQLAPLVKAAGAIVRIVGYTDETGSATRNSPLAQARADRVLADLVARGSSRSSFIAVGRANGSNLAPGTGAESPNRRVEFEIAFDGEKGVPQ